MRSGGPGYTVKLAGRGLPLLLAFGHRETAGDESPRAGTLERVARRSPWPVGSLLRSLAFGRRGAAGDDLPHGELLERTARRGCRKFSSILLRDRAGAGFYRGVAGLGDTIDDVSTALQSLVDGLEPSEVLTFGEGLGGHAALVFGVLLGASRIVAIEPAAHLIGDLLTRYNDRRWHRALGTLPDEATARRFEVPGLMARAGYRGRAFILFGTRRDGDKEDVHLNTVHAQWLARSDRVRLRPFPEICDGTLEWLTRSGQAESVLSHFFFDDIEAPRSGESPPTPDEASLRDRRENALGPTISLSYIAESDPANRTGGPTGYAAVEPQVAASSVSDEGRRWIAEKLLLDASADDLLRQMRDAGVDECEASREIDLARASPYFRGTRRYRRRLQECDRLLSIYRKLNRAHGASPDIERRHRLSGEELRDAYFAAGRCVIITGMIDDWPAPETWNLDGDPPGTGVVRLRDDTLQVPEYLDRQAHLSGGTWLGPAGTSILCREDETPTLVALVQGRMRVKVVALWDLPLLPDALNGRAPPDRATTPANSHLPADEPEVLCGTLDPGELLFLPMGCRAFLETLDASRTVSFRRFAFEQDSEG